MYSYKEKRANYSSYLATGNNPLNAVDPDGGGGLDWFANYLGEVRWFDEAPDPDLGWSKVEDYTIAGGTLGEIEVTSSSVNSVVKLPEVEVKSTMGVGMSGALVNYWCTTR